MCGSQSPHNRRIEFQTATTCSESLRMLLFTHWHWTFNWPSMRISNNINNIVWVQCWFSFQYNCSAFMYLLVWFHVFPSLSTLISTLFLNFTLFTTPYTCTVAINKLFLCIYLMIAFYRFYLECILMSATQPNAFFFLSNDAHWCRIDFLLLSLSESSGQSNYISLFFTAQQKKRRINKWNSFVLFNQQNSRRYKYNKNGSHDHMTLCLGKSMSLRERLRIRLMCKIIFLFSFSRCLPIGLFFCK